MSFQAMAWAVKQKTATPVEKLLLLMLANYADEDGHAWPSKQRLADDCCMNKATVCRNLASLQAQGLIEVTERYHPERGQASSLIRLKPQGSPPVAQRDTPLSHSATPPVAQRDTNLSGNLTVADATVSGAKKAKGNRLTEDWEPSEAYLIRAHQLLPPEVVQSELVKFKNYWLAKAGPDAVKLDWNRTFHNWIIKAAERGTTYGPAQAQRAQRSDEARGPSQRERNFAILDAIVAEAYAREDGGGGAGLQEDHGSTARLR